MATKAKEFSAATPNSSHPNPLISDEKLRQVYSTMLKCRMLHERVQILKKQVALEDHDTASIGQEATAVGVAIDLRPGDTVAPAHRDSILNFVKGVPLAALFNQLNGRSPSPVSGRSRPGHLGYAPLHIISPVPTVVAQLNISTGVALTNQIKNNNNIVVAFSGHASSSPGAWHTALNFAGLCSLPIVFVRQKNLMEESVSLKFGSNGDGHKSRPSEYGFPTIPVDGNDAVAVYRVAQEAIERARAGGGPTLIETLTIRWPERVENDAAKYPPAHEIDEWKSRDPVATMERYLAGKGLFTKGWKKEITNAFRQELDGALEVAENNRFAGA